METHSECRWRNPTASNLISQNWIPVKTADIFTLPHPTSGDIPIYLRKTKKGKYTRPFTAVLLVIIKVHKQYKYPVGRWLNTEYYAPLKKEKGWGWSFLCTDTARCLKDSTKWKIKLQNSVCRLLPFVRGKWEYTYSFIFVLKTGKINLRN